MQDVLYYIRDHLVGTHYFIYAFILFFLMFSIIGYLFKQKYGKYEIKLKTSQEKEKKKVEEPNKIVKQEKKIVEPSVQATAVTTPTKTAIEQPTPVVKEELTKPQVSTVNTTLDSVIKPSPMPAPSQPANPTPMPNTGTTVNPTPIPNLESKQVEAGPIPEI